MISVLSIRCAHKIYTFFSLLYSVRHASLVALSRTIYDGNTLEKNAGIRATAASSVGGSVMGMDSTTNSNSNSAEANNPLLLRALSERMLDTDIPCAITAVGCLSNYVSFYCGIVDDVVDDNDMGSNSNNEGKEDVASLVMVPILLQRLQLSIAMLHTVGTQLQKANTAAADTKSSKKKGVSFTEQTKKSNNNSTSESDKLQLKTNEQYTLLSLTLVTLSGIIENCGKSALQTCGGNAYLQLLSVLNVTCCSIQQTAEKKVGESKEEKADKVLEPMFDTVTNASRALHSFLDDNTVLIATLPLGTTAAAASSPSSLSTSPSLTAAVSQLTNTIIMNTNIPSMARLHASGSILALRRVLVLDKEHQQLSGSVKLSQDEEQIASTIQSCTNEVILPYLASIYDQFTTNQSSNEAKQLLQEMISTSNQLSTIKRDSSLESQIVSKINARKEPAREIARRQKKMKEENTKDDVQAMEEENTAKDMKESAEAKAAVSNDEESEVSMAIEEDAVTEEEKKQEQEDELKDKLDSIVSKWKDIVGSHKLALELVANLCSPNDEDDEDEGEEGMYGDDDDEHMWDSDDEAKLLAEAAHGGMGKNVAAATVTPCEQATYDAMTTEQCNLPMKILSFFRQWADFIPSSDTTMDVETKVPTLVSQDVDELLSTCALCLGNVVACNLLKEKSTLEAFWKDLVPMLKSQYHVHVTSLVMLSLVRNEPQAPSLVDPSTLESLITLLQQSTSSDAEALLRTHTIIISILGVLCTEPHPATINTQVCRALLERLRSSSTSGNELTGQSIKHSVIITHEILNVLMDMYGNDDDDDCHDQVFVSEDVLGHFQRCLPGFKRCIKKVSGSASRGASMEEEIEVDLWNETALNTSRFIKYKRDKCSV